MFLIFTAIDRNQFRHARRFDTWRHHSRIYLHDLRLKIKEAMSQPFSFKFAVGQSGW